MPVRLTTLVASAALLVGAYAGCGGGAGQLPSLIPVKGKVTYKGQPLPKGMIRFEPDGYGRMATGKLQADGTFVLSTLKDGDGAVAGVHKVFITDTDKSLAKDRGFSKYASADTSGLTAEVTADKTDFPFDLK
jgi:hypothetical protein